MAQFRFDEEEDLGKVVNSAKPFCTLSPNRPIEDVNLLTLGICGAKFSKLCGFTFRSADGRNTKFLIVYCPKTRSNFSRNMRGLSGWYCWMWRSATDIEVMTKEGMMQRFMFNVDKFFNSDLFETYLPVFKKQTSSALETQVAKFLSEMTPGDPDYAIAKFRVACVKKSLDHIGDVIDEIETGQSEEARLAYNANSQYSLDMKQKKAKDYSKFENNEPEDEEDNGDDEEE